MKKVYILGIILSVVFGVLIFLFADEVHSLRYQMYDEMMYGNYLGDAYFEMYDATQRAALCALPFITFYILAFSFTFKYIKRTTAKVISIIGVSIAGLILLITLVPAIDPGGVSFDEIGPLLLIFILVMLAFSIVNLVQAVRNNAPTKTIQQTTDDII